MSQIAEVFIYDAVRTPTGNYGGGLSSIRPDDLASHVIAALLERSPNIDPRTIDDVILGNANGAGEENRNVARMAALLAGLSTSTPGTTVNRLCGSGLEAVANASRALAMDEAEIIIAGGVESMSRAPWVIAKPEKGFPRGNETMFSTTLGWRFVNPKMAPEWTISLGGGAELLAEKYSISRDEQDLFAYESHMRAENAWESGFFDNEVVPHPDSELKRDESIRHTTSIESLAKLKPAFKPDGTVTAGNASPLNDGASAVILGTAKSESKVGRAPIARIVSRGSAAIQPQLYGIGPVEAANQALKRANLKWSDLKFVELNEAFAAQSLACLKLWDELDPAKLNPSGGAIALGHALGSSGSRLLATMVNNLKRAGGGYGLITLCIGVGQGVALIIEAQ
jgi:acetyl-CoA acetyltransferase family protein